jgi:hypothetical protein
MIYTLYMGRKIAGGGEGPGGREYFKSKQPLSYETLRSQVTFKTSVCFFVGSAGSVAAYQDIELVNNKLKIFAVREDYI